MYIINRSRLEALKGFGTYVLLAIGHSGLRRSLALTSSGLRKWTVGFHDGRLLGTLNPELDSVRLSKRER